jgi:hypothetical protein
VSDPYLGTAVNERSEALFSQVEDRVTTRFWELDLSLAGKVYSPKKRPANRKRQNIARYLGREGTVERFAIRQTIPYCGHEVFCPPSQAQYGAVCDFFVESCETRSQAHTLLSAREYAEMIASRFSFTAPRRHLISLCVAAFILSDRDLRSIVNTWSIARWSKGLSGFGSARAYQRTNKLVTKFASKLIDDMRGAGSEVFG